MQYLSPNIHKFSQDSNYFVSLENILTLFWVKTHEENVLFSKLLLKKINHYFFKFSKLGNVSHHLGIKDSFLHWE